MTVLVRECMYTNLAIYRYHGEMSTPDSEMSADSGSQDTLYCQQLKTFMNRITPYLFM